MGRSVMTLSDATAIAYDHLEPDEEFYREQFNEDVEQGFIDEDEDFDSYMWSRYNDSAADDFEFYIESTQMSLKEAFPSFEDTDDWIDREIHVIAQNAHSIVTISEYCGAVAICLGPRYDRGEFWMDGTELAGLGEAWRKKISSRFASMFGTMTKLGTFSNGESVFQIAS